MSANTADVQSSPLMAPTHGPAERARGGEERLASGRSLARQGEAEQSEPGSDEDVTKRARTDAATEAAAKEHAIFETAAEFTEATDRYFAECDTQTPPALYSLSGLCLALSRYNGKGRTVSLATLQKWARGDHCEYLGDAVKLACLRIQEQIETDPRYQEKGGMSTKAIFLLKQSLLGGYQDKVETKSESRVQINFGNNMDSKDFE